MVLDMLENTNTYRTLSNDPTNELTIVLDCLLDEGIFLAVLDVTLKDSMLVKFPTCPAFHALPKVHEGIFPPPLRPFISGIGSLLEPICQWLDNLLQPLVHRVPGYIKDTKELLKALDNKTWSPNWM